MSRGRGYCVEGVCTGCGSYASGGGFYGSEEEGEEESPGGFVGPLRATACELRDTSPVGSYWLTKLIVVANFVVALFTGGILFLTGEYAYSTYPSAACIASGGCLPGILLSMFSHANFVHLLGNMAYLYIIGDNVEITLGRLRYLAVYLASGIAGAYTQALVTLALNPSGAHVPMVGASAAISGLVGGYLLLYPGSSMCRCVGLGFLYRCFRVRASSYLALWVLLQFAYALTSPFIAVWAHLGGFFTGLALTYLLADRGRVRELREAIAGGRVRGLPPRRDELAGESLGPLARGAVVAAAAVTALLILASAVLVVAGPRGYYVVYLRYGVEFTCRGNVCSCYEGFLGATYNITRSPPTTLEDVVVPQASPWCPGDVVLKPVAVYNLYRTPLTAVPVAAVAVALLVVTVHTMVRGYREVEVV